MPMRTICPLCGQSIKTDKPLVDINNCAVAFNGGRVRLTARESEIVAVLVDVMPMPIERVALGKRVWGKGFRDNSKHSIVSVYVSKLRRKVRPIGLDIESKYGKGYKLTG